MFARGGHKRCTKWAVITFDQYAKCILHGAMENVLSCHLPINGQFKSVKKRVMVLRSTLVLPLLREILHKCIFKTKCIYFKIRFLKLIARFGQCSYS